MTTFEKPSFELIEFNANDIIATSVEPGGGCAHDACTPVCNTVCPNKCEVVTGK